MPVSHLHRPSPGSRRPGRWRRGELGQVEAVVEHHGLHSERSGQLHQSEPLDLAAPRPRVAQQDRDTRAVFAADPAGGGGAEAGSQRRSPRHYGYGQEGQGDESPDNGLPVLGPGPEQRSDQEGDTQERPDDAIPAPRRPFGDGPPPSGHTQHEPGRTEDDVHTIADQEADFATARSKVARSDRVARIRARAGEVRLESATRPAALRAPCSSRTPSSSRDAVPPPSMPLECGHHHAPSPGLLFEGIVGSGRTA